VILDLPSCAARARHAAVLRALCLAAATLVAGPAFAARTQAPATESQAFQPADTLEGNYLAAYIAGASRDTAAAARYYREAVKGDPRNPELLERAFVSFLADGGTAEAGRAAERLLQRDAQSGLARLALGVRYLKARQYASARAQFGKGSGRNRAADLTATLLSAWSYAGAGEGKRGLEAVDGLRADRTFAVFRDYHAGLIADLVGDRAEAEKRLKTAYEAEKTTLRIVDAYARLESRAGRRDSALAVYRAFDAVAPRNAIVRAAIEQLAAGKTLPQLIASAQEGAAEVLYGLGAAGVQPGDELPSIIYLRLALQLNPEHGLALMTLAEIYERMRQTERSIEILSRVPETSPLRPSAEIQVGLSLEQLGRSEEASKRLEALLAKRPDDTDVLTALGNVQRARKKFAEAAEIYGRAIDKLGASETNWPLYYFRGTSYERAKQWPQAEADLKKALELVPDSQPLGKSQVLNYLGYSWVDMRTNLDEAFKMLKRAVELNPRDGMIIDSLGWAYYRFERYDDAVRELEKATELKPGDPVINDHLGDAYWHVGRRLEARFQWQHAKDAGPEPEDLARIEEKLAKGLDDAKPLAADSITVAEPPKDGG
jgi:tetratricopeptide (TPR) repeat protein